jgi:hypothetical protein
VRSRTWFELALLLLGACVGEASDAPGAPTVRPSPQLAPDAGSVIDAGLPSAVDASIPDASVRDAGVDAGVFVPAATAQYPDDVVQSPLPKVVVDRLKALAAVGMAKGLMPNVATKAGDGNSDHDFFLGCFGPKASASLGNHTDLDAARAYFKSSFGLYSSASGSNLCLATDDSDGTAGGTLDWVNGGSPPLYAQEIRRTHALFMPELFGMLDMGGDRSTGNASDVREEKFRLMHQGLVTLTDGVIAEGAIPMLTSNLGTATPSQLMYATETVNQVARSVAQSRQVPFIDFYLASWSLPEHGGVSGGLHFSVWKNSLDLNDTCALTDDALTAGLNMHNFVVLAALDRMKRVLVDGAAPLDPDQPAIAGSGTVADPVVAVSLPFSSSGDVAHAPSSTMSDYSSCGGGQETGGEYVYQLTTSQPIAVRALVLGDKGHDGCDSPTCSNLKDFGLHVLKAGHCVKTNNTMIEGTLSAGTYTFVVDSYVGGPKSTKFTFTLMACHSGDPACASPL